MTPEKIAQWDEESNKHVLPVVKDLVSFIEEYSLQRVTVLDIGANIGKFITLLSEHCEVTDAILVEPIDELREYSQAILPQYRYESVIVSDTTEILPIYTPEATNLGLSRVLSHPGGAADSDIRWLKAESVATILMRHSNFKPDVIKIDAEGYDIKIVKALAGHLYRYGLRPIIIFECNGGVNTDHVTTLYQSMGYRSWSRMPEIYSRDIFLLPPV